MVCGKCCGDTKTTRALSKIKSDRCCTDIIWLLLYVAAWGALIFLWMQAKTLGANPLKIINGVDMYGNVCGDPNGNESNRSIAAFPYPGNTDAKICVTTCNYTQEKTNDTRMAFLYESVKFGQYCLPKLIENGTTVKVDINMESQFSEQFSSASEMMTRAVGDVWAGQYVIYASGATAILFTLVALVLLENVAGYVVGVSIGCIVAGTGWIAFATFMWAREAMESGMDADRVNAAYGVAGFFGLLAFIALCAVFFMRTQIKIACEVVKEASRALADMKSLLIFPVVPALIGIVYFCLWIYIGLYIWSVTTLTPQETPDTITSKHIISFPELHAEYQMKLSLGFNDTSIITNDNPTTMMKFVRDQTWQYISAYHFFHLLWTVQFIIYFDYLVFAGATADWYFTTSKEGCKRVRGDGEEELSNWPVLNSLCRTLKYHLGTVALCSLIIAIIQMLRATVKYIEKQTQGNPPNQLQKALFAGIQCCLKCLECCLDKLNRNALIWTAIWGDGFCTASCSAFALLWRNLHRVCAMTVVTTILLNLSKLCVCLLNFGVFYGVFMYGSKALPDIVPEVTSPVAPCIIVFLLTYMVASVFVAVFQSIIDAIFLCFLVDLETNGFGKMVANETLQKLVDKYSDENEEHAKDAKQTRKNRPGRANKVVNVRERKADEDESCSDDDTRK